MAASSVSSGGREHTRTGLTEEAASSTSSQSSGSGSGAVASRRALRHAAIASQSPVVLPDELVAEVGVRGVGLRVELVVGEQRPLAPRVPGPVEVEGRPRELPEELLDGAHGVEADASRGRLRGPRHLPLDLRPGGHARGGRPHAAVAPQRLGHREARALLLDASPGSRARPAARRRRRARGAPAPRASTTRSIESWIGRARARASRRGGVRGGLLRRRGPGGPEACQDNGAGHPERRAHAPPAIPRPRPPSYQGGARPRVESGVLLQGDDPMSLLAAAILAAAVSSAVPPPASKADVRKKQAAAAAIDARRADLVVAGRPGLGLRRDGAAGDALGRAPRRLRGEAGLPRRARGGRDADRLRRELRPGPAGDRRPRRVRRAARPLAEGRAGEGRRCRRARPATAAATTSSAPRASAPRSRSRS